MKKRADNIRIGVATFPMEEASLTPFANTLAILSAISDDIHVIAGNAGAGVVSDAGLSLNRVDHMPGKNCFSRAMNYARTQLKITRVVIKLDKEVDVWVFPVGGDALFPAMLYARLSGKPVILALASSAEKMFGARFDPLEKIAALFTSINYALASRIVVYSENIIKEWGLLKYRNKISLAYEHFLDFDKFTLSQELPERKNVIGYIGRLSAEKGIMNLIQAIPEVLNRQDAGFFIIGDGQLKDRITAFIGDGKLEKRVQMTGWVSHEKLPDYLNEMKLLVLPSYTEGLPNIMLEAMACGTPVLTTPVGAIPDVIKDNQTGFLMKDNTPETISESIIAALESPKAGKIAANARALVSNYFTYENAVSQYRQIFNDLWETRQPSEDS
ncbi:glycosyltransferase family 4 protein [Chloroflexota bacterium]